MTYYLSSYAVKGLVLDDILKEVRIVTDINVSITGDTHGIVQTNSGIEVTVKNFDSYDQLSTLIKDGVNNWVSDNYPPV